jgi:hypothetical protein
MHHSRLFIYIKLCYFILLFYKSFFSSIGSFVDRIKRTHLCLLIAGNSIWSVGKCWKKTAGSGGLPVWQFGFFLGSFVLFAASFINKKVTYNWTGTCNEEMDPFICKWCMMMKVLFLYKFFKCMLNWIVVFWS